jgi:ribose transport system permease protein
MSEDTGADAAGELTDPVAHSDPSPPAAAGAAATSLRKPAAVLGFSRGRSGRSGGLRVPDTAALVVVFAALMVFFSITSPVFLQQDNLINVLIAVATIGILACPATMLLVAGQFDLSVGSGIALTSSVFADLLSHGSGTGVAVLAALGLGLVGGVINGFLVTVVGINALITTLGTLDVYSGVSFLITNGLPIQFNGFGTLALDRPLFNVPWSVFIFFAFILVSIFIMRMTVFGRSIYAIGANPLAARLAGIRVKRTLFITFVASGFAVGVSGLIAASQTGQGSPTAGTGYELSVITAVVLGGASLAGGRGTIVGTIFGVLIIGVINDGLTLLNIGSFWQDVTLGTLLILAVGFDQVRLRLAPK